MSSEETKKEIESESIIESNTINLSQEEDLKDKIVLTDSPLKQILVDYVGKKLNPEKDEVTTEMILKVLADEFPESIVVLASENYIAGYKKALEDVNLFKEDNFNHNHNKMTETELQEIENQKDNNNEIDS